MRKEAELLTLIYADDTVQYRDHVYPAGFIAVQAMNIPRESLEEALPLCRRVASVNTMLHTGVADKTAMNSARLAAHPLLKLIAKYEPFTFLSAPELAQRLDQAFTVDAFKKIRAFSNIVLSEKMNETAKEKYVPTQDLLALAPTMANYYDAITMLQEHIAPFAENLDAAHAARTKEAYLSQFSQSFPQDFLMGDGTDTDGVGTDKDENGLNAIDYVQELKDRGYTVVTVLFLSSSVASHDPEAWLSSCASLGTDDKPLFWRLDSADEEAVAALADEIMETLKTEFTEEKTGTGNRSEVN